MARFAVKDVYKTALLLVAVLIHNLIYPLSGAGGIWPGVFYAFFASIFVGAVYALTRSRIARWAITISGVVVFVVGLANSYAPTEWTALGLYVSVIVYHAVIIVVLARYTFAAQQVMTDVVLAATSLYLIIGSVFTSVYGLIEWVAPGSFVTASGDPAQWQQLLYYSYVTLTTLGYGDITPTGFYAQSLAAFEAVTGVLYIALLLSRLVGLHAARR